VILSCVIWTLLTSQAIVMALKDLEVSKQGVAGKKENVMIVKNI
jgi:hypothetical protein